MFAKYFLQSGILGHWNTASRVKSCTKCRFPLALALGIGQRNPAIPPNSRFLYALNASYVFQYDLQATDIAASKTLVAEWDGYVYEVSFATTFGVAQLGPDGKIYICTAFSTPFLHVIEYPDRKGVACQVHQRAILLPSYNDNSIPNHPNYHLGPLDGSACCTLGFENHPLCNWRWE